MISPICYSNYSYTAKTSFGNKTSATTDPQKALQKKLNTFAKGLSLLNYSELTIPQNLIPGLPKGIESVGIQLSRPTEKGSTDRILNLFIKKSDASSESSLMTGKIEQLREYLRAENTPAALTETIKTKAKGLGEEKPDYHI